MCKWAGIQHCIGVREKRGTGGLGQGFSFNPGARRIEILLQAGLYAWLMWNTVPLIRADLLERQQHYRISRQPLMNRQGREESMGK